MPDGVSQSYVFMTAEYAAAIKIGLIKLELDDTKHNRADHLTDMPEMVQVILYAVTYCMQLYAVCSHILCAVIKCMQAVTTNVHLKERVV